MELDPLFMEQRWKILQSLGSEKMSPLQLATKTSTTISNMSQQLKLLEAANIIRKEKIQNRDKGKPRTLFSISKDYAYIVSVMDGLVQKRLFNVENDRKVLLKIWFVGDEQLQADVESIFTKLQPNIDSIDCIILNAAKRELLIVAKKSKELVAKLSKSYDLSIKPVSLENARIYLDENTSTILLDRKGSFKKNQSVVLTQA